MRSGIWWLPVAPCNAASKNCNIGAQLQSLRCIKAPKLFWIIYFLHDFWCAQTCSFRAVLGYLYEFWQLLSALYSDMWKFFLYKCTSTFSVLNYCSGIFFKSLSVLYEVVRTNFSADFWTFRNFWRQFRNNCGATWRCKWEPCSAHDRAIPSEKNRWKWHQNRPINRHTILVWTMSPTRRQTKRGIQKNRSYSKA